jgi:hypothetical protein
MIVWLSLILLASGLSVGQSSPPFGQEVNHAENAVPGLHHFDSYSATGKFIIES